MRGGGYFPAGGGARDVGARSPRGPGPEAARQAGDFPKHGVLLKNNSRPKVTK